MKAPGLQFSSEQSYSLSLPSYGPSSSLIFENKESKKNKGGFVSNLLDETAPMHEHKTQSIDSNYTTKKDLWLVIPLITLSLFFLYVPIIIFSEPVHPLVKIFGSIYFLLMSAFIPWLIFGTSYGLTDTHLIIRCMSRQSHIPLQDIYEVFPTHNPLSAPAFSLDRLRIKFKGSRFGALISPKDRAEFMRDLQSRCHHLIKFQDKLILKEDIAFWS